MKNGEEGRFRELVGGAFRMIGIPWGRDVLARLKDLVEEWSGVTLELTDIYGMREYKDGARLLTHVDGKRLMPPP